MGSECLEPSDLISKKKIEHGGTRNLKTETALVGFVPKLTLQSEIRLETIDLKGHFYQLLFLNLPSIATR